MFLHFCTDTDQWSGRRQLCSKVVALLHRLLPIDYSLVFDDRAPTNRSAGSSLGALTSTDNTGVGGKTVSSLADNERCSVIYLPSLRKPGEEWYSSSRILNNLACTAFFLPQHLERNSSVKALAFRRLFEYPSILITLPAIHS